MSCAWLTASVLQRSPSLTPRWRRRDILRETAGGALRSFVSKDKCARAAAQRARPRQVGNSGSHIYGHCANAWLREARRSRRIRTDERHPQARRRGPLGAHPLAQRLGRGHARQSLFGYSFLLLKAIGPSGSSPSRRCSTATEWPFKDRGVRDPAATTNDPSAAGATTFPRANGHEPMPLLPQAASPQWHRSGTAVELQWHRSGTAVASQWNCSGTAVAPQWHGKGTAVSR